MPPPRKLEKLPSHAKIKKRSLIRPPIPSPNAGSHTQKVVYLTASTPFISAVKRVRRLLERVDAREVQSALSHGKGGDNIHTRVAKAVEAKKKKAERLKRTANDRSSPEEVVVRAAGKAIEKAMSLGLFLQAQPDLRVVLRTSSAGTVDDIEFNSNDTEQSAEPVEGAMEIEEAQNEEAARPDETRIRFVSVLEIGVSLR